MSALRCTVVSPERPLFEGAAGHVVVPGVLGELAVYPRHAPLIGALGPGLVRVVGAGVRDEFAVRGGFLHVKKDVVTILVTDAVRKEDVKRAEVESERAAVVEALQHPRSDDEYEELVLRRRWCDVRLAFVA